MPTKTPDLEEAPPEGSALTAHRDVSQLPIEGEATITHMPHATSTALDLRMTLDVSDPRLVGLMLRGRYLVTIKPIKE